MVPGETCQTFVPPENSINSMVFPADQSICMLLFWKILVQSFMPSFFFFLISVSFFRRLQENIFAFMTAGVLAHLLPSQYISYFFWIFLLKYFFFCDFSHFYSTVLFCSWFPQRKVGLKQRLLLQEGLSSSFPDETPCFCLLACMKQAGIYVLSNNYYFTVFSLRRRCKIVARTWKILAVLHTLGKY